MVELRRFVPSAALITSIAVFQMGVTAVLAHEDCVKHPEGHPHCPGDPTGGGTGEQATCDYLYYAGSPDPTSEPQYCRAADGSGKHCLLDPPNDNAPGWSVASDCEINATLVIPPDYPLLSGGGNNTLFIGWSAGEVWRGEGRDAAITNGASSIRIAGFTIEGRSGVVDCGAGPVVTAVRLNPDLPGDAGPALPRMAAANLTIQTEGSARFCNAIEYAGTDRLITTPYFAGGVADNTIEANAYAQHGILLRNINTTDNVTGDYDVAMVHGNDVGGSSGASAAILVQDVERASISGNTVVAPDGGVGIHIVRTGTVDSEGESTAGDDYLESRPIVLEKNSVDLSSGGTTGFAIDTSRVGVNRGNNVDGSGLSYLITNEPTDSVGSIEFPTKGKRANTCNGVTLISDSGQEC